MNNLEAYKMDGLGNDFIIFDRRDKSISLSKDQIIKKTAKPIKSHLKSVFLPKPLVDSFVWLGINLIYKKNIKTKKF